MKQLRYRLYDGNRLVMTGTRSEVNDYLGRENRSLSCYIWPAHKIMGRYHVAYDEEQEAEKAEQIYLRLVEAEKQGIVNTISRSDPTPYLEYLSDRGYDNMRVRKVDYGRRDVYYVIEKNAGTGSQGV